MEPRLRNILSASGGSCLRHELLDSATLITSVADTPTDAAGSAVVSDVAGIVGPRGTRGTISTTDIADSADLINPAAITSTGGTVTIHQFDPLPLMNIDFIVDSICSDDRRESLNHVELIRLQPILDFLNEPARSAVNPDGSAGHGIDLDQVILPPIHSPPGHNCSTRNITWPIKSSAPLVEMLNYTSPLVTAKEVEALRLEQLRLMAETTEQPAVSLQAENFDEAERTPTKKRRLHQSDSQSTRTLPQLPRTSTRRQKIPAILPPLLAPLHDPPNDARLVPSMKPDAPSGLTNLVGSLPALGSVADKSDKDSVEKLQTQPSRSDSNRLDTNSLSSLENHASCEAQTNKISPQHPDHDRAQLNRPTKTKRCPSKRVRWTTEETQHLIDGVERFGIGSWKKILECLDYKFRSERSSIDLKDRFRTCFPDEYRRSGSQTGKLDSHVDETGKRHGRGGRTTLELKKMGLANENVLFSKQDRRQRIQFKPEEDEALLLGFQRFHTQWKRIQMDPDLGLKHRTRTDLRDRFRNRYPEKFKEAGSSHTLEQPTLTTAPVDTVPSSHSHREVELIDPDGHIDQLTNSVVRLPDIINDSIPPSLTILNPSTQPGKLLLPISKDESVHSLRLLASGSTNSHKAYTSSSNDNDDPETGLGIQLNRSIFDWADQNKLNMAGAYSLSSSSPLYRNIQLREDKAFAAQLDLGIVRIDDMLNSMHHERSYVASLDQLHVNPLDISRKAPGAESSSVAQTAGHASVPLSRILNGG